MLWLHLIQEALWFSANTVGNYISRKAYLEMLATKQGVVSHRYLSPNESRWVMSNTKVGN
jgi:hypothetical protein